ncbi:hypothetical protein AB1484_27000 [Parafrankia sp. FMc6]|uniref:hypothetical protein n=1 Tax=Parafrankia soli TaxID=2599596 RepID=UPI0034D7B573
MGPQDGGTVGGAGEHRAALDPHTRAYQQRRLAEGKTPRKIVRCLKRYVAREIYHALPTPPTAPPA